MGRYKEFIMENMEHPFQNVPTHFVSIHLFRNKLLQDYIFKNGFDGVCHYTGDFTKVLSLQ